MTRLIIYQKSIRRYRIVNLLRHACAERFPGSIFHIDREPDRRTELVDADGVVIGNYRRGRGRDFNMDHAAVGLRRIGDGDIDLARSLMHDDRSDTVTGDSGLAARSRSL